MIQRTTRLKVADNTGAKIIMCIGIPHYSNRVVASLGDEVSCVVKSADAAGTVKNDEIVRAVIVRTHKEVGRSDGSYIRFDDNAAVIIDKERNPRGTRIFGPVARELRDRGYLKIISMAPEVW